MTISTLEELRCHLQTAITIEWSTIPPYLCARWSLLDGHNAAAASCLDDVVMEEMLHLTLVSNLLNAIGGEPQLIPPRGDPPRYPTYLPHSDDAFVVNLLPFSPEALETFRAIERPALTGAPPESGRYHTIAQFYEAIGEALDRLGSAGDIFTGDPARQVEASYYYGGGGEAFAITDLASAEKALEVIVFEGEGIGESIWDGDHELLGEDRELAHYFRFDELYRGCRYTSDDRPSTGPTGAPLLVDYEAVLPMRPNPRSDDHPRGSELRVMSDACDATYSVLLNQLQTALTGAPDLLVASVQTMLTLRLQAIALMRVPVGEGRTAGPAFGWRPAPPDSGH
ncbi:MAG TPA: ferritin-like protein [Solirubrobacteraceae bacterium]